MLHMAKWSAGFPWHGKMPAFIWIIIVSTQLLVTFSELWSSELWHLAETEWILMWCEIKIIASKKLQHIYLE